MELDKSQLKLLIHIAPQYFRENLLIKILEISYREILQRNCRFYICKGLFQVVTSEIKDISISIDTNNESTCKCENCTALARDYLTLEIN